MIGHGVDSFSSHSWAAGRTTFSANSCTHFWTSMTSSDISRLYSPMLKPIRRWRSAVSVDWLLLYGVTGGNVRQATGVARHTAARLGTAGIAPSETPADRRSCPG